MMGDGIYTRYRCLICGYEKAITNADGSPMPYKMACFRCHAALCFAPLCKAHDAQPCDHFTEYVAPLQELPQQNGCEQPEGA